MEENFDYIIVGAGSAGCVLANKLSESKKNTVLVIEAGGKDTNLFIHMPSGYSQIVPNSSKLNYGFDQYEKCIAEEEYRSRVLEDMKAGQEAGVTGTPGFLIGTFDPKYGRVRGELLSGARPLQDFKKALEKYLDR